MTGRVCGGPGQVVCLLISRFIKFGVGFDTSPHCLRFKAKQLAAPPDGASKRPHPLGGSAATIQEILTNRNPKHQHGRTSHLAPEQLADLCAFVLSL